VPVEAAQFEQLSLTFGLQVGCLVSCGGSISKPGVVRAGRAAAAQLNAVRRHLSNA
jgi:hypothetical protein